MANKIGTFDDQQLEKQLNEIIFKGINADNMQRDKRILKEKAVLEAPDGTLYRLTVDNDGNLSTEEV